MPCHGPTVDELREWELAKCFTKYGVSDTELNIATRVACHLAKGEHNELTERWVAEHERLDAERKHNETMHRVREEARQAIADRYGLEY